MRPPAVAGLFHLIPAEEGVAPELAVGGEGVRRAAGHLGGPEGLVHLEEAGVGPDVGAVLGHVDGQVAQDGDALLGGVVLEGLPLAEEEELYALPEGGLPGEAGGGGLHGGGLPPPQRLRPLVPGHAVVVVFQGHEEGVVVDPVPLLVEEPGQGLALPPPEPVNGLAQHVKALAVE